MTTGFQVSHVRRFSGQRQRYHSSTFYILYTSVFTRISAGPELSPPANKRRIWNEKVHKCRPRISTAKNRLVPEVYFLYRTWLAANLWLHSMLTGKNPRNSHQIVNWHPLLPTWHLSGIAICKKAKKRSPKNLRLQRETGNCHFLSSNVTRLKRVIC